MIDLNADAGEFDSLAGRPDLDWLRDLDSVNVTCGTHAGDPTSIRWTVETALTFGLRIGAHPGLPDRDTFGRGHKYVTPESVEDLISGQLESLRAIVVDAGGTLTHVKPHGALYHLATADSGIADAIARCTRQLDPNLVLVGFAGGELPSAARRAGLRGWHEAFADRRYSANGRLVGREFPHALILDPQEAEEQALRLVRDQSVIADTGARLSIQADTLGVHGDHPHVREILRRIRRLLQAETGTT